MSDISLLCILQPRTPNDVCTFSIQISKDITIEELKEVIKKKNEPEFDNFPVEDISLEMVEIPNKHDDVINFFQETPFGEELLATKYIKDYWVNAPPAGSIHILVKPPRQVIFIPITGAPEVMIKPKRKFKVMIGCESTEV